VSHRVRSEDGAIPSPDTNAPRLEGVGARRAALLSLQAVVGVMSLTGDRGAVRRQGHFFTLSHRCRAPHPVPSGHPIRPGRGGRDVGSHGGRDGGAGRFSDCRSCTPRPYACLATKQVRVEAGPSQGEKGELDGPSSFHRFRTTTTPWSRTSTRGRWRSTTTSSSPDRAAPCRGEGARRR
jgi:hypothetical protein